MKQISILTLLLSALLLSGCGGSRAFNPADYNEAIYTPEYASGFTISGSQKSTGTLLTIRNPWQGAHDVQQQIFLTREGAPAPKGFTGQVVSTPVRRVVCMSSSHVAMFDAIGEVQRIVGISGLDYISNDYVNTHKRCGEVQEVGFDKNLNFELLLALQPDVVLLYGISGEDAVITGKLSELQIPYIYIGDYVEESPLGKAEWLVAMAELCGVTDRGQQVFGAIRDRYNTLKSEVAQQRVDAAPKVMLNTPYRDTWFMPSTRSYMVQLIHDAGGAYIYTQNDTDSSLPIDMEAAYLLAHDADVWLNVGQYTKLGELKAQNPKFAQLPVVNRGAVYNNNRRSTPSGGSDFWESGIVCPDKILSDLICIFRNTPSQSTQKQRDTESIQQADSTQNCESALHYYHPLR